MCGIAGYTKKSTYHDEDLISTIHATQAHRGPDHQGTWQDDLWVLLHQRLSIIDLDTSANQPMVKDDWVIIFNGEIYNYRSIRERLVSKYGISFHTQSDTEVLLELYRLKGMESLQEIRGMFSFAIYNTKSQDLMLVRDPYGIKPLFYKAGNDGFSFASELKTLTKFPDFDRQINMNAVVAAINYLWIPGNKSLFTSIKKVPAGHYVHINREGKEVVKSYYQLPTQIVNLSEEEAIVKLEMTLSQSVQRHLVADVPVSALLSGGIDSSLIVSMATDSTALSSYSIGINEEDKKVEQMPDDARYARQLAQQLGLDHHEIFISPEITKELPHMVYHLDEPIGDPAAINTYLISKAARDHGCKVLLSGMGADELFFGYRRQKAICHAQRYQKIPAIMRSIIRQTANGLPVRMGGFGVKPVRWAQRFLSFADYPTSYAYMRSYSYYDESSMRQLFHPDIENEYQQLVLRHDQLFHSAYKHDLVNQMCHTDIHMFMQGLNLTYSDRASMAASVELRVPFIDQEVVELAMSLPGSLKYKRQVQKYLLKKAAENHLPDQIIYRPKASFGAPIRRWISGPLNEMTNDLLSSENIKNRAIFNPDFVENIIKEDKKGRRDYAYQIYQLLTLELWFRQFLD